MIDTDCPENGALAQAAGGAAVLACADGRWRDYRSLEQVKIRLNIDDPGAANGTGHSEQLILGQVGMPTQVENSSVEVRDVRTEGGSIVHEPQKNSLLLKANVVSIGADKKAHVLLDIASRVGGRVWMHHVDTSLKIDEVTTVATDDSGVRYALKISRPL
ncbi:hypothetical protein [Paraburkholderia sp. SIMBA_054]|uniref:hypothetical protein n=1 Tax=Paraburkholderia sp. SIMBA_054 TaxID=3085795 RepID=UPI003979A192